MKRIIIDGYNLLFKNEIPENLELARNQLILDISQKYSNFLGIVHLVFDGKSPSNLPNPEKNIRVHFSGKPQIADDLIKRLIEKYKNDAVEIVTRDNEILQFGKKFSVKSSKNLSFSKKRKKRNEKSGFSSLEDHENVLFKLSMKMKEEKSE
jgi:predicted RNA-binding protein with PIN domain